MSHILLKWAFKGIDMDFPELSDGFQALIICRRDLFVFVDLRSFYQQVIGGSGTNNMKSSGCSYRQIVKSRLM